MSPRHGPRPFSAPQPTEAERMEDTGKIQHSTEQNIDTLRREFESVINEPNADAHLFDPPADGQWRMSGLPRARHPTKAEDMEMDFIRLGEALGIKTRRKYADVVLGFALGIIAGLIMAWQW